MKMDFDPKSFFADPPRLKEEVRTYIHDFATRMVQVASAYARFMGIDRLLPRHVRLIVFMMAQDPIVRCSRSGLCVQRSKTQPMTRVFTRVIDSVEGRLKDDPKYGGIDKKLVKGTLIILTNTNMKTSTAANIYLAACVAEVCGIMLNATQKLMTERTMSLSLLNEHKTTYLSSSGYMSTNVSLVRFVHFIEKFDIRNAETMMNDGTADKSPQGKRSKEARQCSQAGEPKSILKNSHVTFDLKGMSRPKTPDDCFWED